MFLICYFKESILYSIEFIKKYSFKLVQFLPWQAFLVDDHKLKLKIHKFKVGIPKVYFKSA